MKDLWKEILIKWYFTKNTRKEIYKHAFKFLQENKNQGLCACILKGYYAYRRSLPKNSRKRAFMYDCDLIYPYNHLERYPEIEKHRVPGRSYWFPFDEDGHKKRIEILKSALQ